MPVGSIYYPDHLSGNWRHQVVLQHIRGSLGACMWGWENDRKPDFYVFSWLRENGGGVYIKDYLQVYKVSNLADVQNSCNGRNEKNPMYEVNTSNFRSLKANCTRMANIESYRR